MLAGLAALLERRNRLVARSLARVVEEHATAYGRLPNSIQDDSGTSAGGYIGRVNAPPILKTNGKRPR